MHIPYRRIQPARLRRQIKREYGELSYLSCGCTFLKSACINAPYAILSYLFSSHKRITSTHFLIYAHSETHGRSCKKIKEKAIRSVGGSFSCRSRSMAHEVADTHTHTCAHNTYTRTASWIRDCICFLVCFSLLFFIFFFFIYRVVVAPEPPLHPPSICIRDSVEAPRGLFLSLYRPIQHRFSQDKNYVDKKNYV